MENLLDYRQIITKKVFLEHLSVVFIFSVLTVIVTFPIILDFASEAAGFECYDKCHMMWRIWWTDFSFENGLDFYHSNYIFYPDGTAIGGNLAYFTTFIGFLAVQFVDYVTAWNIIWFFGLVFGGYGCYLLANNFNKNYLSSIIAGIIFTFTTYHMAHSNGHFGLSMIVWIPIFVLFLFKLLEKQSKFYPIIGGIVFFLVSFTHLYYFVFVAMFSIVFFAVYIFKQKKISNKTFVVNFSILLLIGLTSSTILLLPTIGDSDLPSRPLYEHNLFSINLENLILPTPEHTTQIISDGGAIRSFYTFFDKPFDTYQLQVENLVFLGYSVIFLSALAVIKYRQKHMWFWLLIAGVFIVMSLGPELKIFYEPTGIILPERILYDTIPEWNELRAPARFIVMANLALAVLASYTVYGLIKNKFSSFKQQLILTGIIGFVILFEFSMIPFSSQTELVPSIYEEIKNDESKFAVLAAPIGGTGDGFLMSDPRILYHQIYHEKPIYGGYESRTSLETMDQTRTYFLNMFHKFGTENDVIKQDLATHGLSLFEYFDIKYLTVHKELARSEKTSHIKQLMAEILNENRPIYEDTKMIVYKIPKPNSSEPFLLLGSGWHNYKSCTDTEAKKIFDCNARSTMKNSEILIVNPTNSDREIMLNVVLSSAENERTVVVSINNKELDTLDIPTIPTGMKIKELIIKPGVNVVTLDTDQFSMAYYGLMGTAIDERIPRTLSFHVQSISIMN